MLKFRVIYKSIGWSRAITIYFYINAIQICFIKQAPLVMISGFSKTTYIEKDRNEVYI